ncbi:hypothetical protein AVEN_228079-1 [Araneus ventricosus]|uniref:Uncharacterized protein n=1 Tax=Araneus ventricosus TaxID=182803 RepID=A0A4Y2F6J2_ARAVE|nr:hypothetical protein AVEN_228079-1 [Araneus ventricosus]
MFLRFLSAEPGAQRRKIFRVCGIWGSNWFVSRPRRVSPNIPPDQVPLFIISIATRGPSHGFDSDDQSSLPVHVTRRRMETGILILFPVFKRSDF